MILFVLECLRSPPRERQPDIRTMFTIRVGKTHTTSRWNLLRWFLQAALVLILLVVVLVVLLQLYSDPSKALTRDGSVSSQMSSTQSDGTCLMKKSCPYDHYSFFLQSGAANVVPPKICINNNLIVGSVLNNAGVGINIVTLNGKTGEVLNTDHFDMYGGDVETLIKFLKSIETGSVVLMASYDEPATKLNDEARKLIADLGSSAIQTLGFRDTWVFVGGKGTSVKSSMEKHVKNDQASNKYDQWPELVQLEGCIPKYLD
ncbi:protein FAM3C [Nothobranchius furzeri]|uniref:Protein FAM3C-like n=3 Tax=Nothobranchius TaxID=28779 RepID=A0A1A8U432_NOTFU|nr:protein FAM3C-like [Nothobranchius furzeri]